jgi:Putative beta-barrel porin-2, OmpL-like. bbp2
MMRRVVKGLVVAAALVMGSVSITQAQDKPAEKPKTFLEEIKLFAYIENSFVVNLGHTGRGNGVDRVNDLRQYDYEEGYTFNMAEFSVKKDPSDNYPFGFGLVVTAGRDAQKNHAIGIFRDDDDAFPFRNTSVFDLQEAYLSYKVPLGSGLTLKAGKFVTLAGYEVIESPNNLNFSRSFSYTLGIPFTHVGALASYTFAEWLTVTAGPIVGWDVADDNNDTLSGTGQVAITPLKDLAITLNTIIGPEQFSNKSNLRYLFNLILAYTGIEKLTLALDTIYGFEENESFITLLGTRRNTDATWWGYAGYVAYDWTEKFRTAARGEYFRDADGARTGFGSKLSLWSATGTLQYKIWKGLVGRLEYRHDQADEKAFKVRSPGRVPTGKSQDTVSVAFYYLFF